MNMKSRQAPPRAAAMVEALRGLGYNTQTALADLIDNSIAAGARHVSLRFDWDGSQSRISILDDGCGMTAEALDRAMRLGAINPLEHRSATDLGRFGLGLKTASFSQCRRLTVASMAADGLQCLRWDLDVLASSVDGGWHLLEGSHPGSEVWLQPLQKQGGGTLVLWECLDRIVTRGFTSQSFLDLIDQVELHLSMVFHRYLSDGRLLLSINGRLLKGWDPFMSGHPSKPMQDPAVHHPEWPDVAVQCHVLPHKDRLTEKEHEDAAGPEGWVSQQGFYVYRNERLLVAGSWLGLGGRRGWSKDEPHRLARIRLDIPNDMDADWKIDIRKSTARPPVALRPWLTRLAEHTRAAARRTFAHRGSSVSPRRGQPITEAWKTVRTTAGTHYRIDPEHPAVALVLEAVSPDVREQVKAMLRVIEETVPVQRIWVDTAEDKDTPRTGFAGSPPAEVQQILMLQYRQMIKRKGYSPENARRLLAHSEPFVNYPDLIAALPDQL